MFGYDNVKVFPFQFSDPAADASFKLFRVPSRNTKIEILSAWVAGDTALNAGTANGREVSLLDGGTAGSGTAIVAAAVGGTDAGGTFAAWVAHTPKAFTISEGTLDANDYLILKYDETGTDAPKNIYGQIEYVVGVGA